jgi:hypothetical protein
MVRETWLVRGIGAGSRAIVRALRFVRHGTETVVITSREVPAIKTLSMSVLSQKIKILAYRSAVFVK